MSRPVSPNTQAILLLTAPLIYGRGGSSSDFLTHGEYKRIARFLRENGRQPADLLTQDAPELLDRCRAFIDPDRLTRLLARGFLLSQAIERWQARAIWVMSRADADYPKRLKTRLKEDSPPVLYGSGDIDTLDGGGLAVVGSRNANDLLTEYSANIGRLAAKARRTVLSGGARGIDQAAMSAALQAGGKAVGVVADSLERAVLDREHRNFLMDGQLVLISPYDPAASFNVGHAMQRNKLIYALSDAALIVSSDYEKGGTWAGAVEQLERLHFVPVFVRSDGEIGKGLEALLNKGALRWPSPASPDELVDVLTTARSAPSKLPEVDQLSLPSAHEGSHEHDVPGEQPPIGVESRSTAAVPTRPADELFAKVRALLLEELSTPRTEAEMALQLEVSKSQVKTWLQRLVKEGIVEKLSKPTRYRATYGSRLL